MLKHLRVSKARPSALRTSQGFSRASVGFGFLSLLDIGHLLHGDRGRVSSSHVLRVMAVWCALVLVQCLSIAMASDYLLWYNVCVSRFLFFAFAVVSAAAIWEGRVWRYVAFITQTRASMLLCEGALIYLTYLCLLCGAIRCSLIQLYGISGILLNVTVLSHCRAMCSRNWTSTGSMGVRVTALTKSQLFLSAALFLVSLYFLCQSPLNSSLTSSFSLSTAFGLLLFAAYFILRFVGQMFSDAMAKTSRVNARLKPLTFVMAAFIAFCVSSVSTLNAAISFRREAHLQRHFEHNEFDNDEANDVLHYLHPLSDASSKTLHRLLLSVDDNGAGGIRLQAAAESESIDESADIDKLEKQLKRLKRLQQAMERKNADSEKISAKSHRKAKENAKAAKALKNVENDKSARDSSKRRKRRDSGALRVRRQGRDAQLPKSESDEANANNEKEQKHDSANANREEEGAEEAVGNEQKKSAQRGQIVEILAEAKNAADKEQLVKDNVKAEAIKQKRIEAEASFWTVYGMGLLVTLLFALCVVLTDSTVHALADICAALVFTRATYLKLSTKHASESISSGGNSPRRSGSAEDFEGVSGTQHNDSADLEHIEDITSLMKGKMRRRPSTALSMLSAAEFAVPSGYVRPKWTPLVFSRALVTVQFVGIVCATLLSSLSGSQTPLFNPLSGALLACISVDLGQRAFGKMAVPTSAVAKPAFAVGIVQFLMHAIGVMSPTAAGRSRVDYKSLSCLSGSADSRRRSSSSMYSEAASALLDIGSFMDHLKENRMSRRISYFLVLNFSFMFVEFAYGYWSNSLGLISDACHMLFDCMALFIALAAEFLSSAQVAYASSDEQRVRLSYGPARLRVLSGFLNGAFLIYIGISVLIESAERIVNPPHIHGGDSLLAVSVMGLFVNMVGLYFFSDAHTHGAHGGGHSHGHSHGHGSHHCDGGGHNHEDHNMRGVFLHVLADTLGSVGVIVSSVLIRAFEWNIADTICSVFIALLIFAAVYPLLSGTFHILLQQTPERVMRSFKSDFSEILAVTGVKGYRLAHFWEYEPGRIVGTMHVAIGVDANEQQLLTQLTSVICGRFGMAAKDLTIQLEKQQFIDKIDPMSQSVHAEIIPVRRSSTTPRHMAFLDSGRHVGSPSARKCSLPTVTASTSLSLTTSLTPSDDDKDDSHCHGHTHSHSHAHGHSH